MNIDARGAYGLHVTGIEGAAQYMLPAAPSWPRWRLEQRRAAGKGMWHITEDFASFPLERGWMEVDREKATTTMYGRREVSDNAMIHPHLGLTGSIAAYWRGALCFHAGAIVVDGRAWAIIGARGAGKSTTLAALSQLGCGIVTDDVLVVEDGRTALAGPRCIDLRPSAARVLGLGEDLGVVGTRRRWRHRTADVPAETPFGGWVVLGWGAPSVSTVPVADRILRLIDAFTLRFKPHDPAAVIALAALPVLHVRRRRRIDQMMDGAQYVVDAIAASGS